MKIFYPVILLVLFVIGPFFLIGRTYFSPLIGIGVSSYTDESNFDWGRLEIESGFKNPSIMFGAKIGQKLNDRISSHFSSIYAKKKFDSDFVGSFTPFKTYEYRLFKNDLLLSYKINNWIHFGLGVNYSLYRNIMIVRDGVYYGGGGIKDREEIGAHIEVSTQYDNFVLSFFYDKGIWFINKEKDAYDFKPVQSLGISAQYRFIVFRKKKGKGKISCPSI